MTLTLYPENLFPSPLWVVIMKHVKSWFLTFPPILSIELLAVHSPQGVPHRDACRASLCGPKALAKGMLAPAPVEVAQTPPQVRAG